MQTKIRERIVSGCGLELGHEPVVMGQVRLWWSEVRGRANRKGTALLGSHGRRAVLLAKGRTLAGPQWRAVAPSIAWIAARTTHSSWSSLEVGL